MHRCKRCGKRLTSPESRSRGFGMECFKKEREEWGKRVQISLFDVVRDEAAHRVGVAEDCVEHNCDYCKAELVDGYYHEDSGKKVCSSECGKKVFDDFKERCKELEIFYTYFNDN